jgi:two-component system, chemotaxis family, response regulator Rcp1
LIVISDGELAVAFIQSVAADETPCPDLVILDLNLPKLPGREVLRYIRASSKCMHVPVVVLTSSDAIQDREDAAFLGASRYIRKPLRLREFLSVGGVIKEIIADHSK